jgi:tetratricopeptide (TPR) repeat protein
MVLGAQAAARGERLWSDARRMARRMERRDWEASPAEFTDLLSKADAAVAAEPFDAHRRYWAAYYHWRDVARRRDPQTGRIDRDPASVALAERVIDMLNDARKLCPMYAAPYSVLGQIEHNYLGRAIGVTHIHVAARLDRNDPTALFNAGEIDARRGKFDPAVEYFRLAVGLDSTVISDVIDLSLDGLHRPELAIRTADGSSYLLQAVANAMAKLPEYAGQAQPVYNRAVDAIEAELNQPDPPAWKYATVASYKMGQKKFEVAERYYATALALDSSQLPWRLQHAQALAAMGRFDDAIREAQTAQRLFPASKEAKELVDSLLNPHP